MIFIKQNLDEILKLDLIGQMLFRWKKMLGEDKTWQSLLPLTSWRYSSSQLMILFQMVTKDGVFP